MENRFQVCLCANLCWLRLMLYQLYSAVRQPQAEIDPDIDIYNCEHPALLHYGLVVEYSKVRDYAEQRGWLVDRKTGLPIDLNNPPIWVKVEWMCIQRILLRFSQECGMTLMHALVMGFDEPAHVISLCTNQHNVVLATRLERRVLRKIREAFDIPEEEQSPKWWWNAEQCGPKYVFARYLCHRVMLKVDTFITSVTPARSRNIIHQTCPRYHAPKYPLWIASGAP